MNQCKATLYFNLKDPDESEEMKEMLNWHGYKSVVSDLIEWIRDQRKYQNIESIDLEALKDKIMELVNDNGVEV